MHYYTYVCNKYIQFRSNPKLLNSSIYEPKSMKYYEVIEQAFWLRIFHTFPLLGREGMHFALLWWVAAAAYAGPRPTVRGTGNVPPSWRAFTYWREGCLSFQVVSLFPVKEMSTDTQSYFEYLFPSRITQGILLLTCLNTNPLSRFIMACMRVSSPASGATVGRDLAGG